jgi:hypothetical protein
MQLLELKDSVEMTTIANLFKTEVTREIFSILSFSSNFIINLSAPTMMMMGSAMIMDTMTTGPNSEIWCRSKRALNMTDLVNRETIEPVSCEPEFLIFQTMIYGEGGGVAQTDLFIRKGIYQMAKSVILCG